MKKEEEGGRGKEEDVDGVLKEEEEEEEVKLWLAGEPSLHLYSLSNQQETS